MDELTPSDSISQSGSRDDNAWYGAAPYPGPGSMPVYPQYYQQPSPYPQAQQYYYPTYGAQVHAQGYPTYPPTPQPMALPTYPRSASRSHHHHHHHHRKGRSRSRRSSSFVSSSTPHGGLASLYVPTVSYSGSGGSTLVPVAANAPYSAPYASGPGTGSYAPYGAPPQPQMLHVPGSQTTYVYANPPASAASPYATHSAATSPNTSPYAMDTRALSSHSHSHSHHSSASVAHSPRSSHSYSHRSSRSHSHSYQPPPPVSPAPSSQPLVLRPNHDESVVVPLASGGCVVFPAQGHSMYIDQPQTHQSYHYPQDTERRKSSRFGFGGLTGFMGRKSKRSRRDSY